MIATEQISVQIPPTSTKVLENTGWHNEQQFISREPVFIHGLIGKQIMGQLNGHLIIEREVQGNQFQEKHRYVQLNDVTVHQLKDVKMRRRGLGTSMVRELEKITLKFGGDKNNRNNQHKRFRKPALVAKIL